MNWMEWIAEHGRLTAALSNIAYESGFHDGDERSGDKPSLHDYRSLLAKAEEALGAHAAKAFAYGMSEAA